MYDVAVIGAGIAGIEAATQLAQMGYEVLVVEKDGRAGGHVAGWDRLFPFRRNAAGLTAEMLKMMDRGKAVNILAGTTVADVQRDGQQFRIWLSDGQGITVSAVLIATGFKLFDARRKEEYGYGIYDNVITSADLEQMFASGKPVVTKKGERPKRVAFIHCVGSRDEKVNNRHCSKVCCATAVKQACEIKQMYPDAEVYCFYMDLRMFDRHFETMYLDAQAQYGVIFVRGRLSEAAESIDGRVTVKAEDTLMGKMLKISVDMAVLMAGMEAAEETDKLAAMLKVTVGKDGFLNPADECLQSNFTREKGVFVAGACTGPKTIPETLADARAAAVSIDGYIRVGSEEKSLREEIIGKIRNKREEIRSRRSRSEE
ncbi:MAG: FAD-dependent oxidoreductase [Bacteroidales bacterium]|jgi:heterodisulfide reductase subunit A|nr:FAD-dependent oxidoreductase [Bacteroidales bacterium]